MPLFNILLGFSLKGSTALSQAVLALLSATRVPPFSEHFTDGICTLMMMAVRIQHSIKRFLTRCKVMQVITGGAIASVAISLASRHPLDPAKPLLDFDMALMLTCPLLLGVSVGAQYFKLGPVMSP